MFSSYALLSPTGRVKELEKRRVLDEAARRRRVRKALEALEQDNFQVQPDTAVPPPPALSSARLSTYVTAAALPIQIRSIFGPKQWFLQVDLD